MGEKTRGTLGPSFIVNSRTPPRRVHLGGCGLLHYPDGTPPRVVHRPVAIEASSMGARTREGFSFKNSDGRAVYCLKLSF